MPELLIPQIEKQDIFAPIIESGGTAIVLQRHERYNRDVAADDAGSISEDSAAEAKQRDLEFFQDVLSQETDGGEVMVLFVSSDTQYADKGRRSLETAQLAQDAASEVLSSLGVDPASRIINLNTNFLINSYTPTEQNIRPVTGLREPQIFDNPDYIKLLKDKYGAEDGPGTGLSQAAWAAHESDVEQQAREELGAEGVYDILDRTKRSIKILERYSKVFHANNPNKRLIIWAASHYDTISPLVKDATDVSFDEYVPVDYGAGIVMNIQPNSNEVRLKTKSEQVIIDLGKTTILEAQK